MYLFDTWPCGYIFFVLSCCKVSRRYIFMVKNAKRVSDDLVMYWRSLTSQEKKDLAENVNTTSAYLRQVFLYGKPAGALLAAALGKKTDLGAESFRPDIFC